MKNRKIKSIYLKDAVHVATKYQIEIRELYLGVFCFLLNTWFFFIAGHSVLMGDVCINPRLIFVSDGRPTDFTTIASCDDCPEIETENVIISCIVTMILFFNLKILKPF